jgi:hypothetical protein
MCPVCTHAEAGIPGFGPAAGTANIVAKRGGVTAVADHIVLFRLIAATGAPLGFGKRNRPHSLS